MRHEHAESCTTHNMIRLVGMLLRASGGALAYADFIERALLNGVLGTQRGTEPGTPRSLSCLGWPRMASDGLGWPRIASDGLGWPPTTC